MRIRKLSPEFMKTLLAGSVFIIRIPQKLVFSSKIQPPKTSEKNLSSKAQSGKFDAIRERTGSDQPLAPDKLRLHSRLLIKIS